MIYVPRDSNENEMMAKWAAKIIGQEPFWPPYMCMGYTRDNKMACVIVAHDLRPPNVCMSIASVNPRWATKENIRAFQDWAYVQLKCTRITGLIHPSNERSRRFVEGIGFRLEGTLRKARKDGGKMLIYGLTQEDGERFLRKRHRESVAA